MERDGSGQPAGPTTRAGTPATVVSAGTSCSTTLPAAIREQLPTVILPSTLAPAPIMTLAPILGWRSSPFSLPLPPSVTLGGTGKERGDRHPKVRRGVLLGAGAKVLGNIEIGACAKIAAGSVVLEPVPAGCTAAGVPARIIGCVDVPEPALEMDQRI